MRAWATALAVLAAVRVAIALVAFGAAGRDLPGLPPYVYAPLKGDANGFYAEARELISAAAGPGGAAAALLLVGGGWCVRRWRSHWRAVAAAALALSLAASALVLFTQPAGAAVVGWPLLWSVVLLPLRAAGALDPDAAFALGLPLQLVANAVVVGALGFVGLYATGRRSVGLVAAGLYAVWPLLVGPLAGPSGWENGQWEVDVGLALYTEPISTALVTGALALALAPAATDVRLALAGALLGFATATKLSNALVAVLVVAAVARWLGPRRALPLAASGAAFVPLVAAYWSKGYEGIPNRPRWSADFVGTSWSESLLYDARTLLVLAPLALLGVVALRRRPFALVLVGGTIVATALLYSFYEDTAVHPRFLHVTMPALFVLQAAGGWLAFRKVQGDGRGRWL